MKPMKVTRAEMNLVDAALDEHLTLAALLDRVRRGYIVRAYEVSDGDIQKVAKVLGVAQNAVSRAAKAEGLL